MLFEHMPLEEGDLNTQWAHLINRTAALRENLMSLAANHSAKFCKAVHSVLNKFLCNYAARAEVGN